MPRIEPAYFRRHSIIVRALRIRQQRRRFRARADVSRAIPTGRPAAARSAEERTTSIRAGASDRSSIRSALAETVGDRIPPIAAEAAARRLHAGRRLPPFVLGGVQHVL